MIDRSPLQYTCFASRDWQECWETVPNGVSAWLEGASTGVRQWRAQEFKVGYSKYKGMSKKITP
jgi:hypothetical protein